MLSLLFIFVSVVLLGGFLALTQYEAQNGVRFFAPLRARFDKDIDRFEFIVAHVDLGAFVYDEVRHGISRLGHASVHLSLQFVRFMERLLTRLVRHLRIREAENAVPRESTREFVKTLSDFKEQLEATHPEVPNSKVE